MEKLTSETENKKSAFEFKDLATTQEYLDWKKTVPVGVRRQVEAVMKGNRSLSSQSGLILSDQFLNTLEEYLSQNKQIDVSGIDKRVVNLLAPLERIETQNGFLNAFETLRNPDASWNLKRRIYETQIKPALDWLREKDLSDLAEKIRKEQDKTKDKESESESEKSESKKDNQDNIPPDSENPQSSMEAEGEKKEGAPNAFFSVTPFFGGYYEQEVFDEFDCRTLQWKKEKNELQEPNFTEYDVAGTRILYGKVRGGKPLSIPMPQDWTVIADSLETDAPEEKVSIFQNQNEQWHIAIEEEGSFGYQLKIAPQKIHSGNEKSSEVKITGEMPDELKQKIEELKKQNLPKMKLKREVAKFIHNHLEYSSASQESRAVFERYQKSGEDVFKSMWEFKKADCYMANTLAVRALCEIDTKMVFAGGYYVKEKNEKGEAIMHSGNGHGWFKVWDEMSGRWVRLDATPKGDLTVDEEQQEKDLEGDPPAGGGEGDFGDPDDELMSEEEVKEKIKEMEKQQEKKKQKEMKPIDLEESRFAELAECTPEQAKEFLKALDRVREIKNERGIPISELLILEWKKIVTERKTESSAYRGPVRMDAGDTLVDPVTAYIDVSAKNYNPSGFEKTIREEKIEMEFGGINTYFSFDLSGSMNDPDQASGRRKSDVQRDAALLFADSMMQCAYVSRQNSTNSDVLPIKIMVTLASEKGEVKLHLTDKWSPKEQWAFYSALNQLAKGGTPTHTTLQLIEKDFDAEIAELDTKKVPKEKRPLHYVVEVSDGEPNDFDATEVIHRTLKKKGVTVRSYCIGGASASEDASEPIESFSQLPEILSKDIIEKFKKLNPRRIRS